MSDEQIYRPIDISNFGKVKHELIEQPLLTWVSIDLLVFDNRFQRSIEKTGANNIEKIAADFCWSRFTPLLVSPFMLPSAPELVRYSVIDGQHRSHAAAICGYSEVPAMVVPMDVAGQARAFAWVNGNVTNVSGFHIFRAALAAGDDWAVQSASAVEEAGCKLVMINKSSAQKLAGEVFCISTIRRLIEADRREIAVNGLSAIRQSNQCEDVALYGASVLGPWFAVLSSFPYVPLEALVRFLDTHPFGSILNGVAKMRETPEHFRSSTRSLLEACLIALFRKFLKEGAK